MTLLLWASAILTRNWTFTLEALFFVWFLGRRDEAFVGCGGGVILWLFFIFYSLVLVSVVRLYSATCSHLALSTCARAGWINLSIRYNIDTSVLILINISAKSINAVVLLHQLGFLLYILLVPSASLHTVHRAKVSTTEPGWNQYSALDHLVRIVKIKCYFDIFSISISLHGILF